MNILWKFFLSLGEGRAEYLIKLLEKRYPEFLETLVSENPEGEPARPVRHSRFVSNLKTLESHS